MVNVALLSPAVVGRKVIDAWWTCPIECRRARARPPGIAARRPPARRNGVVSVSVVVPLFVMLTGATLALPTVVVGNAKRAGQLR